MSTSKAPDGDVDDLSDLSDEELLQRIAELDAPLAEVAEAALDRHTQDDSEVESS